MKIELHEDETLEVVTGTGTSLTITSLSVKKQLGVAGTSDQLELRVPCPTKIYRPYKGFPDGEPQARIVVGRDKYDEVPYIRNYWPETKEEDEALQKEDTELYGEDDDEGEFFTLSEEAILTDDQRQEYNDRRRQVKRQGRR